MVKTHFIYYDNKIYGEKNRRNRKVYKSCTAAKINIGIYLKFSNFTVHYTLQLNHLYYIFIDIR